MNKYRDLTLSAQSLGRIDRVVSVARDADAGAGNAEPPPAEPAMWVYIYVKSNKQTVNIGLDPDIWVWVWEPHLLPSPTLSTPKPVIGGSRAPSISM